MTITVQDIVTGALKKLGVLRKNEGPSADESADAFAVLNDMLGSWSNESLLLYATVAETLSIAAASSYLIGTGQTLNTERPLWIKAATITIGTLDYPLAIIPEDDYLTQINQKTISTTIPQYLTYDNAFPYGTIKLWPVLSQSASLKLLSEKQLTAFAALTTTFSMPPGWSHALKTNLAVLMAVEYNLPADQSLVIEAGQARGKLKKQTMKAHPMTYADDVVSHYSIYTGTE